MALEADAADVYTQSEVDAIIDELEGSRAFAVSDFSSSDEPIVESDADCVARVEITAPVAGQVTVNSMAWLLGHTTDAFCYISALGLNEVNQYPRAPATGTAAGTMQYDTSAGQAATIYYGCTAGGGTETGSVMAGSGLSAMFTATP